MGCFSAGDIEQGEGKPVERMIVNKATVEERAKSSRKAVLTSSVHLDQAR